MEWYVLISLNGARKMGPFASLDVAIETVEATENTPTQISCERSVLGDQWWITTPSRKNPNKFTRAYRVICEEAEAVRRVGDEMEWLTRHKVNKLNQWEKIEYHSTPHLCRGEPGRWED